MDEPVDGREFHSLKGRLQVVMMGRHPGDERRKLSASLRNNAAQRQRQAPVRDTMRDSNSDKKENAATS